jgi:hypothetical protein
MEASEAVGERTKELGWALRLGCFSLAPRWVEQVEEERDRQL